jgi:hypothetical protein
VRGEEVGDGDGLRLADSPGTGTPLHGAATTGYTAGEVPMQVTCLSVPNPRSYLLCAGIAEVENRGFDTDYRGTLYVHSAGRYAYRRKDGIGVVPAGLLGP